MEKKELQTLYTEYLSNEGYKPEVDGDGDVRFKKEGAKFVILIDERDPEFFALALPNIWDFDSDAKKALSIDACNRVNAEVKSAKLFTVKNNVWVSSELMFGEPAQFKAVFERITAAALHARQVFYGYVVADAVPDKETETPPTVSAN